MSQKSASAIPYAIMYALFFSAWGILIPYFNLYLVNEGNSKRFAAWVFAIYPLMVLIAPPVWGYLVDRTFSRKPAMITMLLASSISSSLFFWFSIGWPVVLIMLLFSFFVTPIIPMMDALTLRNLRPRFATARSAGTLFFLMICLAGGIFIEHYGARILLLVMPLAFALAALWLVFVKDDSSSDRAPKDSNVRYIDVFKSILNKKLGLFFLFGFFYWLGFVPYMNLFSIYLEEMLQRQAVPHSGTWLGVAWSISTLAEFVLFLISNAILRRFSMKTLFFTICASSILRYSIYAVAAPLWLLLAAQVLHCINFALFYILATRLIASEAPPSMRNSYQTLWTGVVVGLGGLLGGVLTGWFIEFLPIEHIYWLSVSMTLISTVPIMMFLNRREIDSEALIDKPQPRSI